MGASKTSGVAPSPCTSVFRSLTAYSGRDFFFADLTHATSLQVSTRLTVRLNDRSTYEVHIEMENPPKQCIGGQSLDLERLKTELGQHGCSDEAITQTLHEVDQHGLATVCV
jgi:hypothetical protein